MVRAFLSARTSALYAYVTHTGTVIVSTPQDVALADVKKGIAAFQKLSIPVHSLSFANIYPVNAETLKDNRPRSEPVVFYLPHLQYATPPVWLI